MASATQNLGLTLPAGNEPVQVAQLNSNFQKIDALATPGGGSVKNSSLLANKPPEYYLTPVNLLDNSNFTQLIAQAGFMGKHGSVTYLADRWLHGTPGAEAPTYDETSGVITFPNAGTANIILQKVSRDINGKAVTLAIKASNVSGNVFLSEANSLAGHQDILIQEGITLYSYTAGSNADVLLWSASGGAMKVDWIALYEGAYTAETLPPYVPKPYAVELAECQRYYLPIVLTPMGYGYIFNNLAVINVQLPQPMRAVPTIPNGVTFYITQQNGVTLTSTSAYISSMSGNGLQINVAVNDGVVNTPVVVFTDNLALNLDL